MATDYHNEHRSNAPDYRTRSGNPGGWLLALAAAALLGLLAFFSWTGGERPAASITPAGPAQVTPQPAPAGQPPAR